MKILFMQGEAMRQIEQRGATRAFLANIEKCCNKLYGVEQKVGPVLFNASGVPIRKTLPRNIFDEREPWEGMRLDVGGGEGYVLTKGEVTDEN
jgi:hypothetical protein